MIVLLSTQHAWFFSEENEKDEKVCLFLFTGIEIYKKELIIKWSIWLNN